MLVAYLCIICVGFFLELTTFWTCSEGKHSDEGYEDHLIPIQACCSSRIVPPQSLSSIVFLIVTSYNLWLFYTYIIRSGRMIILLTVADVNKTSTSKSPVLPFPFIIYSHYCIDFWLWYIFLKMGYFWKFPSKYIVMNEIYTLMLL